MLPLKVFTLGLRLQLTRSWAFFKGLLLYVSWALFGLANGYAQELSINIIYVEQLHKSVAQPLKLKQIPDNISQAGALLAIEDSNTTGRFLGHKYQLTVVQAESSEKIIAALQSLTTGTPLLIVANVPTTTLLRVTDYAVKQAGLVINAGSYDDALRKNQCRDGLLHTLASRTMLTDALAQYFISRRWRKWFVISGEQESDIAYLHALERSARRFGVEFVEQKTWRFDTDLRRVAQREVPLFTQGKDYDVVVVADESDLFGNYIPNNTWLPRPVAGTHGLSPVSWHWSLEQWGATQLQNRFYESFNREMRDKDYAAWLAVRSISEAVTRTQQISPKVLYNYMQSAAFELAAFKGRKLSFRPWNGQLRQPIPLVHQRGLTSLSPQEGYLHPHTDLDTLGYDKPEVKCNTTL